MGFEEGLGAKRWRIDPMNFMGLLSFTTGTPESLDLAYERVPSDLQPMFEHRNENEQLVMAVPRAILKSDLRTTPTKRKLYGFAGNIKPESGPPVTMDWPLTQLVCYPKL